MIKWINKIGESYVTYQNKPADFEAISVPLPSIKGKLDYDLMKSYIKVIEKKILIKLMTKIENQYLFLNN